jgi:chromate reductase, NAD(P)H dehydrogenase (quinone)
MSRYSLSRKGLRSQSSNTTILQVAQALALAGVGVEVFARLDSLPHFNPNLNEGAVPPPVAKFRAMVAGADALTILQPGVSSHRAGFAQESFGLAGREHPVRGQAPVDMIGLEGRAEYARVALLQTLRIMAAQIVEPACLEMPHRAPPLSTLRP